MKLTDAIQQWVMQLWVSLVSDTMYGVDISHWQGAIDPLKMKAAGVEFAICKVTQGTAHIDTRVAQYALALARVAIPRSFYHYMIAGDGEAQARHMINTLRNIIGDFGDFPLALDVEEVVDAKDVCAFAEYIKAETGHYPLVYTSVGMWARVTGDKSCAGKFPLWEARWGVSWSTATTISPWKSRVILQYTSSGDGAAHGVASSRTDLNIGDRNWFAQFTKGDLEMQTQIDALKAQVAGLTGEIAKLKQAIFYDPVKVESRYISDLHHRVLANKAGVAELKTSIDGLNQRLTVTQASVVAIDNISKAQGGSIKALEATAVSQGQSINKLSGDLAALPGRLSVVQEFKLKVN